MKKMVHFIRLSALVPCILVILLFAGAHWQPRRVALILNATKNILVRGCVPLTERGRTAVMYGKLLTKQAGANIGSLLGMARPAEQANTSLFSFSVTYGRLSHLITLFEEVCIHQDYAVRINNPQPFIIDCGVNIGLATMYFLMHHPNARILAFEADPTTSNLLQQTITANRWQDVVTAHQVALSNQEGTITLYSACAGHPSNSTVAGQCNGTAVQVPARRLSSYINQQVDLLKIDIEGAEYTVMQELADSGKLALIDQMIIECHHRTGAGESKLGALLHTLEQAGFGFQVSSNTRPPFTKAELQDTLLVHAYRTRP